MNGHDPYNHTGRYVPQEIPIACTLREGGEWIPFPVWMEKHTEAAAVMYGDGAIFDVKLAEWR